MPRGQNPNSKKNLVKSADLSPEERSERARIAGKAPKRKKVKTLRQLAKIVNGSKIKNSSWEDHVRALGITEEEDLINAAVIVAGIFQAAIEGDLRAAEKWEALTAPAERKKRTSSAAAASDPLTRSLMEMAGDLKSDPVPGTGPDADDSGEAQADD